MSRLAGICLAAACAAPLLTTPAHAAYCDGSLSDTAVQACDKAYGMWCTAWDRPCDALQLP